MLKLSLTPDTREGIIDLAREHLRAGQARIQLREGPDGSRSQLPEDEAVGVLSASYLTVRDGALRDLVPLSSEAHHRRNLRLQLDSTIPYYLNDLFDRLDVNLEEPGKPKELTVAEPLNTPRGQNRGHYSAPFPVVDDTGAMRFMQHGSSTLLHEVIHAFGRMTFGFSHGQDRLELRQSGLSIYKKVDEAPTARSRRLFGFFDEALTTITQCDFLTKYMGFESTPYEFSKVYPAGKQELKLNGVDIWSALEATGVAVKQPKGDAVVSLPFNRLYQGEVLSGPALLGKVKTIGADADLNKLGDESKKTLMGLRDREFLCFDSGYAVLALHMQMLSQELWPKLGKDEARANLHACLLRAQVTGDLKPLTKTMKEAFGENAGTYIKALATLDQFVESADSPQICAFVAFIRAANLPPVRRDEVRTLLAQAILATSTPAQEKSG